MELIIGVIGASLVLLSFILNQTHKWRDTSLRYDAVNFIGSALLILYAIMIGSWPFVILNTIWAGVSLRDIINRNKIT